jgi:cytochrome c-type biogenesis protein CcmH/NrfG
MAQSVRKTELEEELEAIEREFSTLKEAQQAIATGQEKDDDTRQEVARKFVRYYFLLLMLIIIGVPAYNMGMYMLVGNNDLAISFKDAILTYSAVVGPTVGLVVAYYFKSKQE